jgi:hypothetical protein
MGETRINPRHVLRFHVSISVTKEGDDMKYDECRQCANCGTACYDTPDVSWPVVVTEGIDTLCEECVEKRTAELEGR